MSEIRKFVSDVGVTFFASAISLILSFPISVLIGRYLGPEDLGLYRMVSTIFAIWILFAALGVPSAVIMYVSKFKGKEEKQQEIISSSIITSIFLGIISFILMNLVSGLFANFFEMPELEFLLKILSISFPFALLNGNLLAVLVSFREMKKNAFTTIMKEVVMLVATFLLLSRLGVAGAVSALVLSSAFTTLFLIHIHKWNGLTIRNYKEATRDTISFGLRTVIANGVNLINYQADILMIGYFFAEREVGVYSIAVMFAKLIWILPDSVQKITYPIISEYHSKEKNESIKKLANQCMKFSFLFLLLASTFMIFFGELMIDKIYGEKFEGAYLPLNLLLIGTVVYGTTKSIGSIFAGIGKVNLVYRIPLVSAIINIILNLILIPTQGIVGGATATSVSLIVSAVLILHYLKVLINIDLNISWYVKTSGITFFLIICGIASSLSIPVTIILMLLQFLIYYRYSLESEEREEIQNLLHRV